MVVAAVVAHEVVKRRFADVAKRWVAQIVGQADGLDQIFVAAQRAPACARSAPLRCCASAGCGSDRLQNSKNLRLVFESTKGRGVNNAVAVALIARSVGMLFLSINATPALAAAHGVAGQILLFATLQLFSVYHDGPFHNLPGLCTYDSRFRLLA